MKLNYLATCSLGFATLEATLCALMLAPIALYGAAIIGAVIDQWTLDHVVAETLRDIELSPLELAESGEIRPRRPELETLVSSLASYSMRAAIEKLDSSSSVGSAACYEVHRVDPHSGNSAGWIAGQCITLGAPRSVSLSGSFTAARFSGAGRGSAKQIGTPIIGPTDERYFDVAVLLRVAVWAEAPGWGFKPMAISAHRVEVPREGVQL